MNGSNMRKVQISSTTLPNKITPPPKQYNPRWSMGGWGWGWEVGSACHAIISLGILNNYEPQLLGI